MRQGWCVCLLLFFASLQASDDIALIFEADEALYNGTAMLLSGHVLVDHEVGTLASGQAILTGNTEGKRWRLQQVDLFDHVTFHLSEGGSLSCAEAHLNQQDHLGHFLGNAVQPFVVYMEECRDASNSHQRLPIIVKSRNMSVEFKPNSEKDLTPKSHINAVVARENVTVDYNHDFIAAADCATFHRDEVDAAKVAQKGLAGMICLHAEGEEGCCHVTNRNGDLIHARQIFVDTLRRRLSFARPKGALFTQRAQSSKERIDFSADTMTWEEQLGSLTLRGQVSIAEKGLGQLTSDDQITLFHTFANGKKQLNTIESSGHTILTHRETREDTGRHSQHVLHCWGKAIVDHPHLKVCMDSPSEEEQVFYEDGHGTLYADRVEVAYDQVEGAVRPIKIILEGRVKMLNTQGNEQQQQFALADVVEVFPALQEALLSAKKGGRVLVYDQVNDMQVSAQGLKIRRDQATKKESIQGIGDVRFNFLNPEFEQLYKRFEQLQKYGHKHE